MFNKFWEKYRQLCIDKDTSEDQISQLKQAFFAGASVITEASKLIGSPDISEDQGVKILSDLCDEVDSFIKFRTKHTNSPNLM